MRLYTLTGYTASGLPVYLGTHQTHSMSALHQDMRLILGVYDSVIRMVAHEHGWQFPVLTIER